MKHIWSDGFSTYLSSTVASLRVACAVDLAVLPPYCHSFNPAENCIRNSSRGCRKNLANLVGVEIQGKKLTRDDVPEWWDLAYEYERQHYNDRPNETTERKTSTAGVTPNMLMTGNKNLRLDLSTCHAFGELGYAVIEPKKRGGSVFEVSEQVIHLFRGTHNSIFHPVSYTHLRAHET